MPPRCWPGWQGEVWRDDLHEDSPLALMIRAGRRDLPASAGLPLRERIASQDVTLERRDVVGELVEAAAVCARGL